MRPGGAIGDCTGSGKKMTDIHSAGHRRGHGHVRVPEKTVYTDDSSSPVNTGGIFFN